MLCNLFAQPLHVLFGLPLGLEPSTSYSIHFFTQSAHAHTIATCFAVVSILYNLFLVFLSTPYLLSKLQIKQTKIHYGHNCKLGWQKNPRFNQLLTSGKFTIPLFHKSTTISFPSPPTDNIVAMMTVNLLCFSGWHSIPPSKTLRSFQTFLFINTS